MRDISEIRADILKLTEEYAERYAEEEREKFKSSGRTPYAGRVYGKQEFVNLVGSSLDFWLTAGRFAAEFEKELGIFLDVPYCYAVNSGSSANLLAFAALTSPLLKERRIKRGDEIITLALGFPTTVAPILQYGCIPVFVDCTVPSYNINCSVLENSLSEKTKAVFIAHTLGNPFNLKNVRFFCEKHGLFLIEDNCDSLGAEYLIDGKMRKTGTAGDIGTSSFYPAHHITTGEGGAVYTKNPLLAKILLSMRDWGRDCVCSGGEDNRCGKRFSGQYGTLPFGYDHKYIYSQIGYNLKMTDMQAAVGAAQIKKLPEFINIRRKNWQFLKESLKNLEDYIYLPEEEPDSISSPFGFAVTLREDCVKTRLELSEFLESKGIQTRNVFAGNMTRQPFFEHLENGKDYRISGELKNTDFVMNNTVWVGVYPGLSDSQISGAAQAFKEFFT